MIGKVLQEILSEKNINVNELAKLIGVSNQTLYSIIKRNNMKIDFEILLKICLALDVNVERFYSDYQNASHENIILSNHEKKLVLAYRAKIEMQVAVNTLLGVDNDEDEEYEKFVKEREEYIKSIAQPYAAADGDSSKLEEAQRLFDESDYFDEDEGQD